MRAPHEGLPQVCWPKDARSIVVVALSHPPDRPQLDWWFGRDDPPGNRILAGIVRGLCEWATATLGLSATHLPYHVERGGTYLKDAAVLAGLGCIGRNNLLVTPRFGPRVRLRALTVDVALTPTEPVTFDPCTGCDAPCRRACPRNAFAAADGYFSREACYLQMDEDVGSATLHNPAAPQAPASLHGPASPGRPELEGPVKVIRYCRACELSCPIAGDGTA